MAAIQTARRSKDLPAALNLSGGSSTLSEDDARC
jgi:hypothetical protein